MPKKYQIFVSSTHTDLKEERAAVYEAILGMEHFPVGMEYFGARSRKSIDLIKSFILTCDFQVTIVGTTYGSSIPHGKISYTEMEYDYARRIGVPQVSFLFRPESGYTTSIVDIEKGTSERLASFREKIKRNECAF